MALIDFKFENHYSYKDKQFFSMRRQKNMRKPLKSSISKEKYSLKLSRVAAIYGANASGKSSFLKALLFIHDALIIDEGKRLAAEPFAIGLFQRKEPSCYDITFISSDQQKYRYTLEYAEDGIRLETLHIYQSQKPALIYKRKKAEPIIFGPRFTSKNIEDIIKNELALDRHKLLLYILMKLGEKTTKPAYDFFKDSIRFSWANERRECFEEIKKRALDDASLDVMLKKVLPAIDVGIASTGKVSLPPEVVDALTRIAPAKIPDRQKFVEQNTRYSFIHDGSSAKEVSLFGDLEESDGTMISTVLMTAFYDTLRTGGVCVVDEVNANLHPILAAKMISIFNSEKSNPNNAQLIFTTHDITLIENYPSGEILDRDQIWFTEKSKYGASRIYSLSEKTDAPRNGTNIGMRYLAGRYGAVPDVSLEEVFADIIDAN